jgi:ribosomal protein S12 methylthiotransferase accessory factor
LNESNIADTRAVAGMIGLVADVGSFWSDFRVGELKVLLALASGNRDESLTGCEWVRHFEQFNPDRRRVYACVENLLNLQDLGDESAYLAALRLMHSAPVLEQALALINQKNRFLGAPAPGLSLNGCEMHQKLLLAYDKVHSQFKS